MMGFYYWCKKNNIEKKYGQGFFLKYYQSIVPTMYFYGYKEVSLSSNDNDFDDKPKKCAFNLLKYIIERGIIIDENKYNLVYYMYRPHPSKRGAGLGIEKTLYLYYKKKEGI